MLPLRVIDICGAPLVVLVLLVRWKVGIESILARSEAGVAEDDGGIGVGKDPEAGATEDNEESNGCRVEDNSEAGVARYDEKDKSCRGQDFGVGVARDDEKGKGCKGQDSKAGVARDN